MENSDVIDVATFLHNNKIFSHIDLVDGTFYNGLIIELSESMLIINDRVLGETPVRVSSINNIRRGRE